MRLIFLVFRFFHFLCKFIIIGEGGSTQINDLGAADARIKLYYVLKLWMRMILIKRNQGRTNSKMLMIYYMDGQMYGLIHVQTDSLAFLKKEQTYPLSKFDAYFC